MMKIIKTKSSFIIKKGDTLIFSLNAGYLVIYLDDQGLIS